MKEEHFFVRLKIQSSNEFIRDAIFALTKYMYSEVNNMDKIKMQEKKKKKSSDLKYTI